MKIKKCGVDKAKATEPLTGRELMVAAHNQIVEHPETWNQRNWHCGTMHCFGGWCQVLSGRPVNSDKVLADMKKLCGLTDNEVFWVTAPSRQIGEIHNFVKNFTTAGFDRDGFDRAGFDRDGFDRDGFDRAGFDRDGRDRAGFDRAGFDRDGRDRDGFDRAGFDRAGFDRAGFDRAGRDRAGNKLPLL